MKTNHISGVLLLFSLMRTVMLFAETERVGDYTWQYFVRDGKAWIGSQQSEVAAIFPKPVGEVTVPSELGGYEVYRIDDYALYDCNQMTKLIIPDCVHQMGAAVFRDCTVLTTVHLPRDLEFIAENIFKNCSALSNVQIPSTVVFIDQYAFSGCSSLRTIDIPPSVKEIRKKSFECPGLRELTISEGVEIIGEDCF